MTKLERRIAMTAAATGLNVYIGLRPGGTWFAGIGAAESDGPSAMSALAGVVDAVIAAAAADVAELRRAEQRHAALNELKGQGP